MKIFISAAETSSDQHSASLMVALQAEAVSRNLQPIEFFGLGGAAMRSRGFRSLLDSSQFLVMGFVEILSRLLRIFDALRTLERAVEEERPDAVVVVDYPDFHFRLTKKLERLKIPLIYYVPPKVWAWRKKRAEILRTRFAKVISILPFEVQFLKDQNVNVAYVGNPLLDQLPLTMSRQEARRELQLPEDSRVIVVMPGSRPAELRYHWEVALEAASRLQKDYAPSAYVLIPLSATVDPERSQKRLLDFCDEKGLQSKCFRLIYGKAHLALRAADVGIIKSGTSTLEAALLGCPHVVLYKANWLSELIFKWIVRYTGPVSLTNLVFASQNAGALLVKELLGNAATADSLYQEAKKLISDTSYRSQILQGLEQVKNHLQPSISPSLLAAREVLAVIASLKK